MGRPISRGDQANWGTSDQAGESSKPYAHKVNHAWPSENPKALVGVLLPFFSTNLVAQTFDVSQARASSRHRRKKEEFEVAAGADHTGAVRPLWTGGAKSWTWVGWCGRTEKGVQWLLPTRGILKTWKTLPLFSQLLSFHPTLLEKQKKNFS